jgi:hypothetical protein
MGGVLIVVAIGPISASLNRTSAHARGERGFATSLPSNRLGDAPHALPFLDDVKGAWRRV